MSDDHKASPIKHLQQWREKNQELFQQLRVQGLKNSPKVRAHMLKLHADYKQQWKESARRNPKLNATEVHIAAKKWRLQGPDGKVYTFRNLKKFVRDHSDLFNPEDVNWKEQFGTGHYWCRASQELSRLRPTRSQSRDEWNGWKWQRKSTNI